MAAIWSLSGAKRTSASDCRSNAICKYTLQINTKRPRRKPGPFFALRSADDLADGAAEIGAAIRHRQHDHLGADADPRIEIADVLVGEAEAA